jgi:hypothetical protein
MPFEIRRLMMLIEACETDNMFLNVRMVSAPGLEPGTT